MMDNSGGYLVLFGLVACGVLYIACKIRAANADAELQRTHPELWRQKELLKLEKERLAAEKELAEERAKQENLRRNVGVGVAIGRVMGWW